MSKHNENELVEKVLFVNRCAKVVKGGRKFSFSALVLVGNENGKVGYGFAKANELTDAIRKAGEQARKDMHTICMHGDTIPHEVLVKWDGVEILFKPAPEGSGVIAGSQVRAVLEAAGVKDVMAKNLGGNNPINQVKATFKALQMLVPRDQLQEARA
ncbi:MAG: 30S ribosomal protein S5 [Chlamydiia bacterium]|nr:30S ribosomal protein S5 [Chlamydiia bacterium]